MKILLPALRDPSHRMNLEASICLQNQDVANLRREALSHSGLFKTERRAR
jgi:hypothetical protein